jgi:parvulin-like peptidyl-prolyl isomerase
MRIFLCLIALAAMAAAQAPPPPITPDTVVAKTGDGKDVTVADIERIMQVPQAGQALRQNPAYALGMISAEKYMSDEAARLKLGDASPWREQIELATENLLMQAMMRYVADHYQVTPEQTEAYYKEHISEYQQFKIKAIKINFKPDVKASVNDLKAAAEEAFQAAHATTDRSEADAKKIAEDVVKQARGGADFNALVTKYGEGESKDFNGDFPPVKQNGMYPAEIKKTVFAMKPGEVSDPIEQPGSFYVIRVTGIDAQPLNDVREDIIHTLRTQHTQDYIQQLLARFKPQILRPDYFYQMDSKVPAKKPGN